MAASRLRQRAGEPRTPRGSSPAETSDSAPYAAKKTDAGVSSERVSAVRRTAGIAESGVDPHGRDRIAVWRDSASWICIKSDSWKRSNAKRRKTAGIAEPSTTIRSIKISAHRDPTIGETGETGETEVPSTDSERVASSLDASWNHLPIVETVETVETGISSGVRKAPRIQAEGRKPGCAGGAK